MDPHGQCLGISSWKLSCHGGPVGPAALPGAGSLQSPLSGANGQGAGEGREFCERRCEDGFLVGGLVAIFYFPINIGNFIIPIDELIFFRGVGRQPPTSSFLEWEIH